MESPCINVCVLDDTTRTCIGCGRSIEEIAGWRTLTDAERRRIMGELAERRRRMQVAAET
jgi:uncharacterized protein